MAAFFLIANSKNEKMETPIETTFSEEMMEPKRPQFLTVICVLSFIWCGLSVVMGIWSIIQNTPERMAENIEQMRAVSPQMAEQMEEQMIAMQESTYAQVAPYLNFSGICSFVLLR